MFEGLEKIGNYRKGILYFGGGSIIALFVLYSTMHQWKKSDPNSYLNAQIAFQKGMLQEVKEAIVLHPELTARYAPLIAQQELKEGVVHIDPQELFKRTQKSSPHYTAFSAASLLIAQGSLHEALQEAKSLKQRLRDDKKFWENQKSIRFGATLDGFNLMRIAVLEKEVGSKQEELLAWNDLEETIQNNQEAYDLFLQHFKEQDLSLIDYIHHRQNELKN